MFAALLSDPASAKRFFAKLFGVIVTLLAPFLLSKLGITITDTQVEMVAGIVVTYLLQSGYVAAARAQAAGVAAAEKVTDLADAAKVLAPEVKAP
jgi:hypothetical protein